MTEYDKISQAYTVHIVSQHCVTRTSGILQLALSLTRSPPVIGLTRCPWHGGVGGNGTVHIGAGHTVTESTNLQRMPVWGITSQVTAPDTPPPNVAYSNNPPVIYWLGMRGYVWATSSIKLNELFSTWQFWQVLVIGSELPSASPW